MTAPDRAWFVDPPTPLPPGTRPCRAEYTSDGRRHPGDRLVLCGLAHGHDGPHIEDETGAAWAAAHQPDRVPVADITGPYAELPVWLVNAKLRGEWRIEGGILSVRVGPDHYDVAYEHDWLVRADGGVRIERGTEIRGDGPEWTRPGYAAGPAGQYQFGNPDPGCTFVVPDRPADPAVSAGWLRGEHGPEVRTITAGSLVEVSMVGDPPRPEWTVALERAIPPARMATQPPAAPAGGDGQGETLGTPTAADRMAARHNRELERTYRLAKESGHAEAAAAIERRILAELLPKCDTARHEGGYDCCGCSTYDEIVRDAASIARQHATGGTDD